MMCSCKKIGNPKTTVDIKKQIYDRFGDEYSLIGEYKNARTKIRVRHNECGHEYEVFAYNLVRKYSNKCPNCSEDKR